MTIQNSRSFSSDLFNRGARRPRTARPPAGSAEVTLGARMAPHRLTAPLGSADSALTVELRGAIDAGTLDPVDAALQAALARLTDAVREVLIDMSAVEFISATGLSRLLWFVEAAAQRDAACTVVGGTAVARPVQVLELRPLLPVYASAAAAQAAGHVA